MRRSGLLVIIFIILFLVPSVYSPQMMPVTDGGPFHSNSSPVLANGGYPYGTGTGQALNTIIRGTVVEGTDVPVEIDSDTMTVGTIGISGDYAATGLGATLDTFTMTTTDVLRNPSWNTYHQERWHVGSISMYDDQVTVPNYWTLTKSVGYEMGSYSPHPLHGDWELNDDSSGYSGTRGWRFEAVIGGSDNLDPDDALYLSQQVHAPWRELYSVQISFFYYVTSGSNLYNQTHLFTRFAGIEDKFLVFEPGDTTDTWLQASVTIPSTELASVALPDSLLFEIGLGTDVSGTLGSSRNAYAYIDEIEVELEVRPFPEQVGLRVNGTEVVGSAAGSTFPFVPKEDGRDCWDYTSGIDLDGYNNDARPEVGIWGTFWNTSNPFELGLQFPLDIPRGAVIERAYLETESSGGSGLVDTRVHVAINNSAGQPVDSFSNHVGLHLEDEFQWLDTSINWMPDYWTSNVRYSSPDIAPLLQKAVSSSSWTRGQYVAIMLSYMWSSSPQHYNNIKGSYDASPSNNFTQQELSRLYVWYRIPHADDVISAEIDYARSSLQYKKDITVDHTKVSEELTNFPVLIDIHDSDLKAHVKSGGADIAFKVGNEFVDHEIELFNQNYSLTEAHLVAWVKVPVLSSSVDTVITMFYGGSGVSGLESSGIWDDYEIVQHMNDVPNGTIYDSTDNHHSGPSFGSMTYDDLVSGAIGTAIDFDGSNDVISVGQIDTDEWTEFTITGWAYQNAIGDDRIFSKAIGTDPAQGIMHFAIGGTEEFRVRMVTDGVGGGASGSVDSVGATTAGSWHYLAWSWSASTTEMRLYLNGTHDRSGFRDGDSILDSYIPFVIGNWQTGTGNNRFFGGMIDELRMTQNVLSDGWIAAEFANQVDPSSFYSIGSEQANTASSDSQSAVLVFSAESPLPVSIGYTMSMDFEGSGKSFTEDLTEGTTFHATNGSAIVEWTAKVLVSPPPGIHQTEVYVEYPATEWIPVSVLNPLNQPKSNPTDWTFTGGRITLNPSSVDVYGLWTIKFESLNYLSDFQLGLVGESLSSTGIFQTTDSLRFQGTSSWLAGSATQLFLTDPTGSLWGASLTNSTIGSPSHVIPSFAYRKVITIDNTKVHDDLTHFPAFLEIIDSDLDDKAQADGDDIVFVQNGIVIPHEMVEYDPAYSGTEARLIAWVRANLTALADTDIEMYYGNSLVGPQELPDEVWSNGYVGVWHLEESPTGAAGEIKDSTSYRNDGTTEGTMNAADFVDAKIGKGLDFDEIEADNLLRISDSSSLDSVAAASTIQLWIWFDNDAMDGDRDIIMESSNRFNGNPNDGFEWATQEDGDIFFYPWGGVGNDFNMDTNLFANRTWHQLAVTLDYSIRTELDSVGMYIDGSFWSPVFRGVPVYWTQTADLDDWLWGGDPDMPTRYFDGRFDEIRVSNVVRSAEWLETEYDNLDSPSTFYSKGVELPRDPNSTYFPSFTRTLDNTAPAGIWTATIRFNDSGSSIDHRVGIYEREFTVKHTTSLTLLEPTETIATAGDWIYIEYEFTDTIDSQPVPGATVTMNWTVSGSGTQITLDDYNTGVYGKMVNTAELEEARSWRIEIAASHPFYNDATESFNLDLYHATNLEYRDVSTTPVDFDFTTILIFTDTFDNAPIDGATVVRSDAGPLTVNPLGQGKYNISIDTSALGPGDYWYIFNATKAGTLLKMSSVNVTFTLRQHYTSVSVQGNLVRPYGFNTSLHIVLTDLDTGGTVPLSAVTTFSFDPASYGVQNRGGSSYDVTLTTDTWNVATESVTLTVVLSDTKYKTPQAYSFDITIRARTTSVSVYGALVQPFGNSTPLTIVLNDTDTGGAVPIAEVNLLTFDFSGGPQFFLDPSSNDLILDTSDWSVGITSVTLSVNIPNSAYSNPSNYVFGVTIRSMTTVLYHDPTDLVFAIGSDFEIDLRVNVSEPGVRHGVPVAGLTSGEFSVDLFPFSIDNAEQNIGRYHLTILYSDLGGGSDFTIRVSVTPSNVSHASTQLVIHFVYREVQTSLTSPNHPQVTTPYATDVQLTLNYTDIESENGIDGATISNQSINVYSVTNVGGGIYTLWLDVSGLAEGTHSFDISADKSGYEARSLSFSVRIRIAYTYAIPSVGALDIPIGNSPVFFVDYWDIDHDVPVDNSSAPYTQVFSTWSNFSVTYVPAQERYRIIFMTSDSDTLQVNQIYTFNFSRGVNYQFGIFNLTVTIRAHNTDFRLTEAVEPTSNIGIINMTVYYGDLDNGIGVDSGLVDFRVENVSGPVVSSYYSLTGGFYVIQIDADQFGLGLQTFTVYADWTGPVAIYQNKNFVTTANILGLESSLALLLASEPTPYSGNMTYKFFYSDLGSGAGIHNLTNNVFIHVSFQGETVDLSQVRIIDHSATQQGNYSIQFNTTIFGKTGLIYMNVFVNWSKGVAPFYQNRTDTVTLRVLSRDTLLSVTPPSPTSFGENATFTFTYEDLAGETDVQIRDSPSLTVSSNVTFSYTETAGVFEIEFNTTQFGGLGQQAIRLDVTWSGAPFYANRTNRIVFMVILARQTFLEYLAPAPTQYEDVVKFNVTWNDITKVPSTAITGATLTLYEGAVPINGIYYYWTEAIPGVYSVNLTATYHSPGTYDLTVVMSSGVFYIEDSTGSRQFTIRERITLVSAEPVRKVPYNSSIEVIVYYQDLFTTDIIRNITNHVTLQILTGGTWYFTLYENIPLGYYELSIETFNHPELVIGTTYTLSIRMSYDSIAPYYASDDLTFEYELRIRDSTLELDTAPVPTAYANDASFTLFYNDADSDSGISNADISVYLNSTLLVQGVDYTMGEGSAGYYTLGVDTAVLAGLGLNILNVHVNWTGTPYHENLTMTVNVIVRERSTVVELTQPPSQTQYLDDVKFTFVYKDIETGAVGGTPVLGLTSDDIRLFCENGTEILSGYSFVAVGSGYQITVNSAGVSAVLDDNYNMTLLVDWDGATAPYYSDRATSLRLSIAGRTMIVEPDQIIATPITGPAGTDNLTISFSVSDAGNQSIGIEGAIILLSCQEQASFTYWLSAGMGPQAGEYTIEVDTASLTLGIGTGTYNFDLEVRWNPLLAPFYSNRSAITLTGVVDEVLTNLQAESPVPAAPQIGEYVYVIVTYEDLDHGQIGIGGASLSAQYAGGVLDGILPQGLTISPTGILGEYNVSFSTADIPAAGSYSLRITAEKQGYAQRTTSPTISAQKISTEVAPQFLSYTVNWTGIRRITVDYNDLLNGVRISNATVTWSYGLEYVDQSFEEIGSTGQYYADVDTSNGTEGSWVILIQATKDTYHLATTTVTLVVLPLPSEIQIRNPVEDVTDVNRGVPVDILVYLKDVVNSQGIDFSYVDSVYITFQGMDYDMGVYNGTIGYFGGTLPGSVTGALESRAYDVRITAMLTNYELAINQFKVNILQTETMVLVWDDAARNFTSGRVEFQAVYLEVVNFTLQVIAPAFSNATYTWFIDNATTDWIMERWQVHYNFTNRGNGIYELLFNTSEASYGVFALTFRAEPVDTFFAVDDILVVLTIDKISTEVVTPIVEPKYWGWKGNLSFTYRDTHYDRGVSEATVSYSYLDFQDIEATDLGNGTYLIYIDTSLMVPSSTTRYPVLVTFQKGDGDYESRTAGIQLLVLEVPTEILVNYTRVFAEDVSTDGEIDIYELEIPLGDSIDFEFFYNDTDDSDGYTGGLPNSPTNITDLDGANMFGQSPHLTPLGDGRYTFRFDTTDVTLYDAIGGEPEASDEEYIFTVTLWLANRTARTVQIRITIVPVPTLVTVVDSFLDIGYGIEGYVVLRYWNVWNDEPVRNANVTALCQNQYVSAAPTAVEVSPGQYRITFMGTSEIWEIIKQEVTGADIEFVASKEHHQTWTQDDLTQDIEVRIILSPTETMINTWFPVLTPLSLFIMLLLAAYVRIWSVPKRLRQINAQIKALKKGKIPKPIDEAKTRQEMLAELFNDTYSEVDIKRAAYHMPEESVTIEVPEMGELLIQLAILTNLSTEELEEFKGDISKMRISEQATFVKEVIMQEAMRAARRDGTTVDKVVEETRAQAVRQLKGEEAGLEAVLPGVPEEKPLILFEEKEEVPAVEEEEVVISEEVPLEEEAALPGEKLSDYEIEELRRELTARGVPPHEIDTIMAQAKVLPRELVEELVRSLGGDKK